MDTPENHVRMKHLDPNARISIATSQEPDATGGFFIPMAQLEAAMGGGFYVSHDDDAPEDKPASVAAPDAPVEPQPEPGPQSAAAPPPPSTEPPTPPAAEDASGEQGPTEVGEKAKGGKGDAPQERRTPRR